MRAKEDGKSGDNVPQRGCRGRCNQGRGREPALFAKKASSRWYLASGFLVYLLATAPLYGTHIKSHDEYNQPTRSESFDDSPTSESSSRETLIPMALSHGMPTRGTRHDYSDSLLAFFADWRSRYVEEYLAQKNEVEEEFQHLISEERAELISSIIANSKIFVFVEGKLDPDTPDFIILESEIESHLRELMQPDRHLFCQTT
jgi:hypothetical protein